VSVVTPTPSRVEVVLVVTLALAGSALGSLAIGQDVNVDLLNYHFYNGYAFLAGRLERDIAPAGIVSYFNPLLDAVHYAGMRHLPPKVFGALLGAFQGLNLALVWAIARRTLGRDGLWLAPVAAVLAGLGQNAISLLGTTFADTTVSVPMLAALFLMLEPESRSRPRVFVASLVGGAAVGLKPTIGAAHVGLAALALQTAWRERRVRLVLAFGGGTLVGWGLTNGWWALAMWRRFANPFFPLLNNFFHSPFGPPGFRLDPRWGVREPLDWLRPPIDAALGFSGRLQEVQFRDPRLLLAFLALLVWLVVSLLRARSGVTPRLPGRGLVPFWLVTYATWLGAFHYYRYGAVLELLAPVVAFVLLQDVWPGRLRVAAGLVAIGLLLSTDVNEWGRRDWRSFWFNPRIPALGLRSGQVVFLRDVMLSFAIPFLPADSSFVGVGAAMGPATKEAIQTRVRNHSGSFLMLGLPPSLSDTKVRAFGLALDGPCELAHFAAPQRVLLCPLARVDAGREQGPTVK
jgi:hypothetical protein